MRYRPFLILGAFLAFLSSVSAAERKPNIVFILADDLGLGELGCYGQTKIRTPNIDRLAAEGMRFTQFYSGSAVCAPSRCTLLTGRDTGHAAVRGNLELGTTVEGQQPMPRDTATVAQQLQRAGYYTGIIGKWGLGMPAQQSGPNDFGFDYSYGYLCQRVAHTYYPDHLWRNGVREELPGNPPTVLQESWQIPLGGRIYAHDLMADDALRFVHEHRRQPFFLYLAFTIPHFSLQVPDDSLNEYHFDETPYVGEHYASQPRPKAAYAGMITRMDRDIGRLMDQLKRDGLDKETIVFFSSDNGVTFIDAEQLATFFHSANGLRGMKDDLYEGGIRAPFIARWPGHIPPGTVSDKVGAFWDMMPTFCALAGVPAPPTDGISLLPVLLGGQPLVRPPLYWEYYDPRPRHDAQAVRLGDWKGIRVGLKGHPEASLELYDLAVDPNEKSDVAAQHPEVVARIREVMARREVSPVAQWNF